MNKKFSAAAIGGSLSTIIVWLINLFSGVTIPAEVATAIGALTTFAASLAIPDSMETK